MPDSFHLNLLLLSCVFKEAKQSGQKRERVASDVNEESVKTTTKVLQTDTESTQKDKSSTPVPKKHKAKALQDPQDSTQNFKPYDYSQSNMKMFDGKIPVLHMYCMYFCIVF